jgi:superfamily II DNA/RNA helicase
VQQFLAAKNMAVVPHPPYSPDLAPCDFFLFPRMKSKLKVRHFQEVTEIQEQSLPAVAESLDPLHKLVRGVL